MRKILYKDKVIQEVLKYLEQQTITLDMTDHEINLKVSPTNKEKIRAHLSKMVKDTRYQVQSDEKALIVTVFNGQM